MQVHMSLYQSLVERNRMGPESVSVNSWGAPICGKGSSGKGNCTKVASTVYKSCSNVVSVFLTL